MKIFYIVPLIIFLLGAISYHSFSQPIGYYNGTEGKSGEELKSALHGIIKNHVDYSYYFIRDIINYSDADPENENNVILFYLQESKRASLYGAGGDYINREHVWAKSHGFFGEERPTGSDAFNLRPSDASVNEDRGNKDFDNVQPGGYQHPEATKCWYTDTTWEPGPLTKGQVARILFYMATRYEGTNEEMDLELVRHNNTFPNPEFGNLTTLLEWNKQYPPSDFERRRNERLFQIQQNRNPFVDNPDFANMIWDSESPSTLFLSNFKMTPQKPIPGETVKISLELATNSEVPDAIKIYWGDSHNSENNQEEMTSAQSIYTANINIPNYQPGEMVYFKVEAKKGETKSIIRGTYLLPKPANQLTLMPISNVQGTGTQTPLYNNKVTVAGRVTANFDGSFYIQNGSTIRNGICIYGSLQTGNIGDSLVITGTATEYSNLTELSDISYLYNFETRKEMVPIEIPVTSINEDYEGMLIKVKGVEFSEGGITIPNANKSYTFSNPEGNSVIFSKSNSRLVGNQLPIGKVDLVGVVGQYQGTYQILPRDMADLDINTATSAQKLAKNKITIYPNPVYTVLNINSSDIIVNIQIYDLLGRLMIQKDNHYNQISVENLPAGIYLLKTSLNDKSVIFNRFIKSE